VYTSTTPTIYDPKLGSNVVGVVEVVMRESATSNHTHTHTQKDPKRSLDGEVCGNTSDFKIRKKTNPKSLK